MKPFNDAPTPDPRRLTEDPSSTTREYDAYRQGVELTMPEHYAAGMVRIHAGFRGETGNHKIPHVVIGQSLTVRSGRSFDDAMSVPPSGIVGTFDAIDVAIDPDTNEWNTDGVIEPLDIRASLRRERLVHKLSANVCDGESVSADRTDRIVSLGKPTEQIGYRKPLDDASDELAGLVGTLPEIPESPSLFQRQPFRDPFTTPGVRLSYGLEEGMKDSLLAMRPSTAEYVPDGFVVFGSTGFDY